MFWSGLGFYEPNMVPNGPCWFLQDIPTAIWSLGDPCMTFDPTNMFCSDLGFFWPHLVLIGHFYSNLTPDDLGWPLHDLWPYQYVLFWSGVLLTKYGSHRAFLKEFDPRWHRVTPAWPVTPTICFDQVWAKYGYKWAMFPKLIPLFQNFNRNCHGHTYIHTYTHTDRNSDCIVSFLKYFRRDNSSHARDTNFIG